MYLNKLSLTFLSMYILEIKAKTQRNIVNILRSTFNQ